MAREGEELAKLEKAKGASVTGGPGRGKKNAIPKADRVFAQPMTLAELGIDPRESARVVAPDLICVMFLPGISSIHSNSH